MDTPSKQELKKQILRKAKSVHPIPINGKQPQFAKFPEGAFSFEYPSKEWLMIYAKFWKEFSNPEKIHNRDKIFRKGLPKDHKLTRLFINQHVLVNRNAIDPKLGMLMTREEILKYDSLLKQEIGAELTRLHADPLIKNVDSLVEKAQQAAKSYDYENDHLGVNFSEFENWVQEKGKADLKIAILYSYETLLREWWGFDDRVGWDYSHFVNLYPLVTKGAVQKRTQDIVEKNTGKQWSKSNFNSALDDLGLSYLP